MVKLMNSEFELENGMVGTSSMYRILHVLKELTNKIQKDYYRS